MISLLDGTILIFDIKFNVLTLYGLKRNLNNMLEINVKNTPKGNQNASKDTFGNEDTLSKT